VTTLITGVDADGKSCVVNQDDLALDQVEPGFAMGIPYATTTSPPPAGLVLVGTPPPDTAAASR